MGQARKGWRFDITGRTAALGLILSPAFSTARILEAPKRVQVADGIYVFMTPP